MHELPRTIPDVRMLLALAPEERAATILFLLKKRNDTKFHPGNLQNELWGHFAFGQPQYPAQCANEINQALAEAWAWLQTQGLLVADMENGQHGWQHLSRRARAMESEADFKSFKLANLLPKEILHPKIADPVWRAFMRGEFDVAAFQPMKAVEVSRAGGLWTRRQFDRHEADARSRCAGRGVADGHERRRRRKGRSNGAVRRRNRFLQESTLPPGREPGQPVRGHRGYLAREPSATHCGCTGQGQECWGAMTKLSQSFGVSHDRMFLRGLGLRVLELGGESGTDHHPTVYPGSYVEYVQKLGHEAAGIYS